MSKATISEMSFGNWIKHLRKQQDTRMTQSALAKAAGLSLDYIGEIERDYCSSLDAPPRVSERTLRALATALGVSDDEMLARAHSHITSDKQL